MQIIKVPGINGLGKTIGCEKAPNAILNSLKEIQTNEQGKEIEFQKLDLEEIHLDNSNLELTNKLIYKNSYEIFEEHEKAIFLGGDHSISYSIAKAFLDYAKKEGKEPCIIIFNAHADCMKSSKQPTNEDWLRKLIEKGFPSQNILLVGARNIERSEMKFLKEKKIQQISVNSIIEDIDNIADTIMEFCHAKNFSEKNFGATKSGNCRGEGFVGEPLNLKSSRAKDFVGEPLNPKSCRGEDFVGEKETFISIDISVIDPAFAPGVRYNEPGGLTSRQFIYLIQRINKIKSLRGVGIVEINPTKDKDNLTVKLGAKILSELI